MNMKKTPIKKNNINVVEIICFLLEQCVCSNALPIPSPKTVTDFVEIELPSDESSEKKNETGEVGVAGKKDTAHDDIYSDSKNSEVKKTEEDINEEVKKAVSETNEIIESLLEQLEEHGFTQKNIRKAFMWFLSLLLQQKLNTNNKLITSNASRILLPAELDKISTQGWGFILSLEQVGILTPNTREVVLAQLMQLPRSVCSMDEIRWIVLMVLLSQNDKNTSTLQLLEKYTLYLM